MTDKMNDKLPPIQFEPTLDFKNGLYLKKVRRYRKPFERGIWVEIAPKDHVDAQRLVRLNQQIGLEVLIDENGVYRACVCRD